VIQKMKLSEDAPLTHELLSEDIGTTREIVRHYMNQFRKHGYLQYSRKGIVLHRDAFHNWLRTASPKPAKFRTLMSPGHWETAKLEKCVWVAGSENHVFVYVYRVTEGSCFALQRKAFSLGACPRNTVR